MTQELQPIDPDLWTDGEAPQLMGGQKKNGEIIFPIPFGHAAKEVEPYPLSRKGKLWSWTSQGFRPKSPYEGAGEGPHDFKPFLLGYVEIPGEVIVESYIVGTELENLHLGMELEFTIIPFNETHSTFAFQPEQKS